MCFLVEKLRSALADAMGIINTVCVNKGIGHDMQAYLSFSLAEPEHHVHLKPQLTYETYLMPQRLVLSVC